MNIYFRKLPLISIVGILLFLLLPVDTIAQTVVEKPPYQNDTAIFADAFSERFEMHLDSMKKNAPEVAKDFDDRCPGDLSEGVIENYFQSVASGDSKSIDRALLEIYSQASCVSARRFSNVVEALIRSISEQSNFEEYQSRRQFDQSILPVAILLFDLASGSVRNELWPLLRHKLNELEVEIESTQSHVHEIGFRIGHDFGLLKLTPGQAMRLVDSMDSTAYFSGRCSADDVESVSISIGQDVLEIFYCAQDCSRPVPNSDISTGSIFQIPSVSGEIFAREIRPSFEAFFEIPEIVSICDIRGTELSGILSGPASVRIASCLDDFERENLGIGACLIERTLERRGGVLPAGASASNATVSEATIGRDCWKSEGDSWQSMRHRYLDQTTSPPQAGTIHTTIRTRKDSEGNVVGRVEYTQDSASDGTIRESSITTTRRDGSRTRVTVEYNDTGEEPKASVQELDRDGNPVGEETQCESVDSCVGEHVRRVSGEPDGGSDCAPDDLGCSDSCSSSDQAVQDFQQCTGIGDVSDDTPGEGPDPRISMPNPDGVGGYEPEINGLAQCLFDAGLDPGGVTRQQDCEARLRCPDGLPPEGENCTCLPEQNASANLWLEQICPLIDCDERIETCPCFELGGGDDGGVAPVGPSPDPSPRMIWFGEEVHP